MRKTLLRTFGVLFFALIGVMTGNAGSADFSGW